MNSAFTKIDKEYNFALFDDFQNHLETIFGWWLKSKYNSERQFYLRQFPYKGIAFFLCKYVSTDFVKEKINFSIAHEVEHLLNQKSQFINDFSFCHIVAYVFKKYNLLKDNCIFNIKGLI